MQIIIRSANPPDKRQIKRNKFQYNVHTASAPIELILKRGYAKQREVQIIQMHVS